MAGPKAEEEEVLAAAKTALADEFIDGLPAGLSDASLASAAIKLSGGQRQRLAIARALLKERTDPHSGRSHFAPRQRIGTAGTAGARGVDGAAHGAGHRASLVHDPAGDKIVVLDDGRIAEIGTHDELIERRGIYHHLHDLQHHDPSVIAG